MTYRKSPQKAAAKRDWDRFIGSNQPVIASTGLPDSVFASVDQFDAFLSRGSLDSHIDPSNASVDALNSTQYDALVTLTNSYFAAGYDWFAPVALRAADQDSLARRFAG